MFHKKALGVLGSKMGDAWKKSYGPKGRMAALRTGWLGPSLCTDQNGPGEGRGRRERENNFLEE